MMRLLSCDLSPRSQHMHESVLLCIMLPVQPMLPYGAFWSITFMGRRCMQDPRVSCSLTSSWAASRQSSFSHQT